MAPKKRNRDDSDDDSDDDFDDDSVARPAKMPRSSAAARSSTAVPRRSTRRRIVPLSELDRFFEDPAYVPAGDSRAGGIHSTVVLGPNSFKEFGTDAISKLPRGIIRARKKYPSANFKSGHLVNADFGGNGADPDNLTILTATGNRNQQSFDNPVKVAAASLTRLYKVLSDKFVDITQIEYGIQVDVEVSNKKWGESEPDIWISEQLICNAEIYGELDLNKLIDSNKDPVDPRPFEDDVGQLQRGIDKQLEKAQMYGEVDNPKP